MFANLLPVGSQIRRRALVATGWTIVALGVVVSPVPGPGGIPLILFGGAILLRNSPGARRSFVRLKRRRPGWFGWVDRMRRRPRGQALWTRVGRSAIDPTRKG